MREKKWKFARFGQFRLQPNFFSFFFNLVMLLKGHCEAEMTNCFCPCVHKATVLPKSSIVWYIHNVLPVEVGYLHIYLLFSTQDLHYHFLLSHKYKWWANMTDHPLTDFISLWLTVGAEKYTRKSAENCWQIIIQNLYSFKFYLWTRFFS